jgi:hypothetical protein
MFVCLFLFAFFLQGNANLLKPNQEVFLDRAKGVAPLWMEEQIKKDLEPYKSGITKEIIDTIMTTFDIQQELLVRFKVINNQLFYDHRLEGQTIDRFLCYFTVLAFFIETTGLPDLDFVITLHDKSNDGVNWPIMAYGRNDRVSKTILIPDFIALGGYDNLLGGRKVSDHFWQAYPWEWKEKKAFWRGSTTGGWFTKDNWFTYPRTQLALFSLQRPDLLDAKITTVCQDDGFVKPILLAHGLIGNFASIEEQLKYRYLIDVDGNGWTVPRCFWILLANSLLLKQTSDYIVWYSAGVIPYKHYLPVTHEAEDIFNKIEWAKNHDEEAKQMAMEATYFALNDLSLENTYLYLYKLLIAYSQLQK